MGVFIMKEIKLSQLGKNKGKFVALVDDEDYEYLNQFRWSASKQGTRIYAKRYSKIKNEKRMHRLIMNTPDGMEVDHIDHNGLNNQKSNLRICNRSQNSANKKPMGGRKYRGICHHGGKVLSYIAKDGEQINLGSYETEDEAAKAYDKKALELYGEFANLNFK